MLECNAKLEVFGACAASILAEKARSKGVLRENSHRGRRAENTERQKPVGRHGNGAPILPCTTPGGVIDRLRKPHVTPASPCASHPRGANRLLAGRAFLILRTPGTCLLGVSCRIAPVGGRTEHGSRSRERNGRTRAGREAEAVDYHLTSSASSDWFAPLCPSLFRQGVNSPCDKAMNLSSVGNPDGAEHHRCSLGHGGS